MKEINFGKLTVGLMYNKKYKHYEAIFTEQELRQFVHDIKKHDN
jgi:hypothetical protein